MKSFPRKFYNTCFCVLFLSLFFSCSNFDICDCLERSGNNKTSQIEIEPFKFITIKDKFLVYLVQDTLNQIIINGPENLIKNVSTEVMDSVLTISNSNICNFTRSYNNDFSVYIHFKQLNDVCIIGPSKLFSVDTLNLHSLLVRFKGDVGYADITVNCYHLFFELWQATGEYRIHGKSSLFQTFAKGTGFVFAENLECEFINVVQASTGDYYLSPVKRMTLSIENKGDIYYKNSPEIIVEKITSTGKLIKL